MSLLSITIRILVVFAALALLASCTKRKFTGDDAVMVEYAKQIGMALNSYHQETAEWPETLRAAEGFLAAGTAWPLNPYNNQPIEDTGSPSFDPATSVGMVYYEKFYREDQLMNYQLHVFGDKGVLYVFGNTAFGAKR